MPSLAERYQAVSTEVADAISAAGRDATDVELIVISKNHGAELVRELYALGQRHFGENRDQEAKPKAAETSDLAGITWHFVGQLQSNKTKSALSYTNVLHSIDRASLVSSLKRELQGRPERLSGFIQLNLTDDPGRGGIEPKHLTDFATSLLELESFDLLGVMGVAALDRDPRIDFETIAEASAQLRLLEPKARFISAGMSHDFRPAIEFGATHLRIGTAITGKRNL
ncbi:MAG: YggS family pyridoxal phosphate-dependent enzyme [Rhodoluna sp.]|nr:YggS family pyridoxal phosphate-dependent enzyme [Rhodoluna sp.]MBP6186448.1 YggS family pyridoxal phosphate-dependent enzyme [Rhodoluna sp.]